MLQIGRWMKASMAAAMLVCASQAFVHAAESSVRAETTMSVSMVHDIPESHPRIQYFNAMVETARRQSQGKVNVVINPGGVVLPGRASLDAVRNGTVNLAWINAAHLEHIDARAGFINLPFGINDDNMLSDGDRQRVLALLNQILRKKGLVVLGMMRGADQLFIFKDKQVRAPEDLNTLKVRVAGPGIYEEIMQALGAEPVVIPIPQITEALAQRALDGIFTSPGGWKTTAGLQLRKAVQIPGLMFINYVLVADADRFEHLSNDVRAAIQQAARTEVTGRWTEMRRDDEQVLRDLSAQGAEIWIAPKGDKALSRARLDPIVQKFSDRAPDTAEAFHKIIGR